MAKSYGNLKRDDGRIAIMAGKAFVTQDVTGTPKTSPLTVSSSVITIAIPTNCHQIILYTPTNDIRISNIVGMTTYFVLVHGVVLTLDVANMDNIFLVRDAGADAVTSILFNTI